MMGGTENNKRQGIRTRDVVSYAVLPRVLPRITELFFTGFTFFAFFMAQVYRGVRLLPEGHPSLNPANVGQYGIRDVIVEAGRHLEWKRGNIDQILVYVAILIALLLLVLQAATFIVALAMPQAFAGGYTPSFGFGSIFGTPPGGGAQDIAFILLDRVFGVEGIFNSCISNLSTNCAGIDPQTMKFDEANPVYRPATFPWPYHYGLHALFQFYSLGLLLVGVFILLYYVIVIVAETAQTGTPFGKRFDTVWAPIRIVLAFGLLIPVTNGLNSAQYITLYAAKFGSNFATNGWIVFNRAINGSNQAMAQNMDLAVKPKAPDVSALLQFMTLAHTCKVYEEATLRDVSPPPPAASSTAGAAAAGAGANAAAAATGGTSQPAARKSDCTDMPGKNIEAYIVKPGFTSETSAKFLRDLDYKAALAFSENKDIRIRFGDRNCQTNTLAGNVAPTCGEITLPVTSLADEAAGVVQSGYYDLIKHLWGGYGSGTTIESYANKDPADDNLQRIACDSARSNTVLNSGRGDKAIREYALSYVRNGVTTPGTGICREKIGDLPPTDWRDAAIDYYSYGTRKVKQGEKRLNYAGASPAGAKVIVDETLNRGVTQLRKQVTGDKYRISSDNLYRGWAGAGIWYNRIAEMNGSLTGAAWNMPSASMYPEIMMNVLAQKQKTDAKVMPRDMFSPTTAQGSMSLPGGDNSNHYAAAMDQVYQQWENSNPMVKTGNVLADSINWLFGIDGLFDLHDDENQRAHPLALLVGVGKGLVESSIRNMGIGIMGGGAGILASIIPGGAGVGGVLSTASGFFFSIATMTLTAGFILFYVIPFLPFLYFFFAVGNWLKGVFEAMVGVPLWALAHIRIDGKGLAGDGAMNGYFMIFEIFLRPILILFGFLASITIFAAMAAVLHEIFDIAVDNLTGAGDRTGLMSAIDKFFYTCMYAVIMYIMALSSFKLIDLIPNQIMRWLGTNVSTFSDMQGDPASSLTQMTAIAGSQIVGGMTGGIQSAMGGMQKGAAGLGQVAERAMTPRQP